MVHRGFDYPKCIPCAEPARSWAAQRLGSEWTGPCKPCAGSEGALAFAAPFVAVATSLLPLAVAMSLLPLTGAMSLPPRPTPTEPLWAAQPSRSQSAGDFVA